MHYTEKKRVFMIHVSTNDYIIKHATHTIPSLLKCVQLGYNISFKSIWLLEC